MRPALEILATVVIGFITGAVLTITWHGVAGVGEGSTGGVGGSGDQPSECILHSDHSCAITFTTKGGAGGTGGAASPLPDEFSNYGLGAMAVMGHLLASRIFIMLLDLLLQAQAWEAWEAREARMVPRRLKHQS